jgi:F-type H+-transporting ATPase subunit delta
MNVVSKRYARALAEALPPDEAPAGLANLRQLSDIVGREPGARKLLLNPVVPRAGRERFIAKLAVCLDLAPAVSNIFSLLVERRRLGLLGEVGDAFEALLDERTGTLRVVVTAAAPLEANRRADIAARLEQATGKRIVMRVREDPSILGGIVVRVGSTVMDASLGQRLRRFGQQLLAG